MTELKPFPVFRCGFSLFTLALGVHGASLEAQRLLHHQLGPVHLRPQFEVSTEVDDNISYRGPGDEISDFISVLGAGLDTQVGKGNPFRFDLNYSFRQALYADNSDLNYLNHRLELLTLVDTSRFKLKGKDQFDWLENLLGGSTGLAIKVPRLQIADDYSIEYALGRKSLLLAGVRYSALDVQEALPVYDYNTWMTSLGAGYQFSQRLRFFVEGYYGQTAVTPNVAAPKGPHLSFLGGFVGVQGQISDRLTGALKVGYEVREFSGLDGAVSSPVFDAGLSYQIGTSTRVNLAYVRSSGVSVLTASQSFTGDTVTLGATRQLGVRRKWVAGVSGSFFLNEYEQRATESGRTDQQYRLGANVSYKPRPWLETGLAYAHESFSSTLNGIIDYTDNRVTLQLSVGY